MNQFHSMPLQGDLAKRFQILIGLVGSPTWWRELFDCGACIAGGSAMFVADPTQCISQVGDIDVWFPRTMEITPIVESLCAWLTENELDHRIRMQNRIVTVINPILNVQFICAAKEQSIVSILDGFDYDCVQCAIYANTSSVLRNGKELISMHLLVSDFAREAHKTRELKWINLRKWKFAKFKQHAKHIETEREEQRLKKLQRKGFHLAGQKTTVSAVEHDCIVSHRVISQEYWELMSQTTAERFETCRDQIASMHFQKSIPLSAEFLRSEGLTDDQIDEYLASSLEKLKLDEANFKTAVIQYCQKSENQWVHAPTTERICVRI